MPGSSLRLHEANGLRFSDDVAAGSCVEVTVGDKPSIFDAPFAEQIELFAMTDEPELAERLVCAHDGLTREQRIAVGQAILDRYWTIVRDVGFEAAGRREAYDTFAPSRAKDPPTRRR